MMMTMTWCELQWVDKSLRKVEMAMVDVDDDDNDED